MAEEDFYEEEEQDGDVYEHFKLTADEGQALLRIDKFLIDRIPNTSRNKISTAAANGNILVNGSPVKASYKVKPHDEISIVFPHPKRELELIPENIPLEIVHEDDHVVVINKPANMVVHPGYGNYTGTLVNALLYHFKNLPVKEDLSEAYPGLVHRIDKDTTGLLLIAKSEIALNKLAKQFHYRTIERRYRAIVWGDLENEEGTIIGYVGRSPQNRKVMTVFPDGDKGKYAVTHYKVIERLGYVTYIECKLDTGRTHQIRIHMKYLGHPLFGDKTYGGDKVVKGTTFSKYKQFVENCFEILPRQALHAKSLGFEHPATGKWMQFESELPADMEKILERWRTYVNANNGKLGG